MAPLGTWPLNIRDIHSPDLVTFNTSPTPKATAEPRLICHAHLSPMVELLVMTCVGDRTAFPTDHVLVDSLRSPYLRLRAVHGTRLNTVG